MADVKWIKISTDIFNDEKILMLEGMPNADSIIIIWFKLLVLAGKQNNNGVFMMPNRVAYTDEMLAAVFKRDIKIVRMALKAFEQFGMIEYIESVITIPNWGKHQSLDAYEKKKARDRERVAKKRAMQKLLVAGQSPDMSPDTPPNSVQTGSGTSNDQSLPVAVSEEDKERDIDIDIDIEEVINKHEDKATPDTPPTPPTPPPAPVNQAKRRWGKYRHVELSDQETDALRAEYGVELAGKAIKFLDEYIEEKPAYESNSHYLAIKRWVIDAVKERERKNGQSAKDQVMGPNGIPIDPTKTDLDAYVD